MTIWKFENWCAAATDGIIFPPDREHVRQELLNHLYDHYDDLVAQGVDKETAETLALAAMGSAAEIAPQLAEIHRPFWGYLLRATRIVLALLLCVIAVYGSVQLLRNGGYSDPADSVGLNPFAQTLSYHDYGTYERVFYTKPNVTVRSGGYTMTLTKAAVWHRNIENPAAAPYADPDTMYFQIRVFNPRPWAAFSEVPRWIWAVDSLGNTYDSYYGGLVNYAPYVSGNLYHTGPGTCIYDMWISDFRSADAEWIEFHYDRSGRDLVWRLDLTGGDAA